MAVNYTNNVKTARLNATRTHFQGGTLVIRNSENAALVTFTLAAEGGSVTDDEWTIAFTNSTVAAGAGGVAHNAVMITSGDAVDLTGLTVGTSESDVILDNTNIADGQNVTISSAKITHA